MVGFGMGIVVWVNRVNWLFDQVELVSCGVS